MKTSEPLFLEIFLPLHVFFPSRHYCMDVDVQLLASICLFFFYSPVSLFPSDFWEIFSTRVFDFTIFSLQLSCYTLYFIYCVISTIVFVQIQCFHLALHRSHLSLLHVTTVLVSFLCNAYFEFSIRSINSGSSRIAFLSLFVLPHVLSRQPPLPAHHPPPRGRIVQYLWGAGSSGLESESWLCSLLVSCMILSTFLTF